MDLSSCDVKFVSSFSKGVMVEERNDAEKATSDDHYLVVLIKGVEATCLDLFQGYPNIQLV